MSDTEIKIVGYCRTCGTGLDEANLRTANGTIYCAEHVPPPMPDPPSPYTAPPPPPPPGDGSPGAAFVLGMIPGVGAIYNGQYAKGIVHVVIVALLIMAADNASYGTGPLFGLLIPGFWFYMAFEAYHTARRKRDGLPVDEFSGLGIGEHNSRFPIAAVLLIIFGFFFLLNNLGFLEIRELMRYWPVAMIGLGLYLLYARMKGNPGGSDEPK